MANDQTENARRELRALLQRRDFLSLTSGAIASLSGLGALAGCGSSPTDPGTTPPPPPPPPGSIPTGMTTASGNVSLPSGSSLTPASMTVSVAGQNVAVSAAGQFTVGVSPAGPTMGLLLDSNGDPVFSSIFDPSASSFGLSSRTTAVALLYYGIGAFYYPPAVASRILALLNADPAVAAIDNAIALAVKSDTHAVSNGASAIANAVGTALRQIIPAAARTEPPLAKLHSAATPTLLLVTPSEAQDGISVNQDPIATAVIATNTWRRSAQVFVYRVSTQVGTQPISDIRPAQRVAGPIDLSSTENISLFTALKDIVRGTSPASPVTLPSIPLDLNANTDRTSYQVVIIEASARTHTPLVSEPGFFSDPHYTNELADWRLAASDLFNETIVGELAMPLLCLVGGYGAITLTHAELTAAVRAGKAAFASTQALIVAGLEFGSMGKLSGSLIRTLKAVMSNDIAATACRAEVKALVSAIDARAIEAKTAAEMAGALSKGMSMLLKVFEVVAGVGLVLDAFDTGLIMTHFISSNIGVLWDATVVRQLLGLTPQSPVIASGDRASFSVSNPANTQGGVYEYDWTQTSAFAVLSAVGESNVGQKITTTKRNVDLVTTPSDVTPVTVTVVGYDKSTGQRVEIGRAATTVTFIKRALITPGNAFVDKNAHQIFVVTLEDGPPAGAQYKWTLTGGLGSIGPTTVITTTVPQIDYVAGLVGGAANLHVDVSVAGTTVARGDAPINVAGESHINVLITGSGWNPDHTPPDGAYNYIDDYGVREPIPEAGNPNDAIFIAYHLGGSDNTIGVLVTIVLPHNVLPLGNQNFSKVPTGGNTISPGQWQLTMSKDQSDVEHSEQFAIPGSGSLKIDAIGQLPDKTYVMNYSAVIDNGGGGVVVVSGTCRFK